MSDLTVQRLARKIRELRTERGLTLQEVAEGAGFSKGLLSKVETGVVALPIATLAKLAAVLEVPIGEFFEVVPDADETEVYFPKSTRREVRGRLTSHNYHYELLLRGRKRRDMQPMLITVDAKTYKSKLVDHAGEQFIYLLEGEMDYVVGDKLYTVKPGDCLYFSARLMHGPKLRKHQKATYLVVFSGG